MKILVERHAENDRIAAEKKAAKNKELHTVRCNHCDALLCFPDEAVDKCNKGYCITCPCCNEDIILEDTNIKEINKLNGDPDFIRDKRKRYLESTKSNKEPHIDVIEEGNFYMNITCSNCESELQFDYRDCKYEPINNLTGIQIRDYPSFGYTVKCPVCNKILIAKE